MNCGVLDEEQRAVLLLDAEHRAEGDARHLADDGPALAQREVQRHPVLILERVGALVGRCGTHARLLVGLGRGGFNLHGLGHSAAGGLGEDQLERLTRHLAHPRRALAARQGGAFAIACALALLAGCIPSIERARAALDEGEPERAVTLLEALAAEHTDEPGAWLALGRALMAAGRPAAARQSFERAAQLLPSRSAPRILIGHTYELERRYDEAQLAYEQACGSSPNEARPERVLGARLLRWGRAAEAVPHLARAVELDPSSASTWNALAVAQFHAGDGTAALETFARAAAAHESSGLEPDRDLALGRAALLVRFARYEEALALYDAVVAREPGFAPAHVGRALVLHELGRCEAARAALERSVRAAGDTPEARARLEEYRSGPGARCAPRAR